MHLQTIIHSVAKFSVENAAARFRTAAHNSLKAALLLSGDTFQGIARGFEPHKASAAQAVAAFFTRVVYHSPYSLSSIFMRIFEKLCFHFEQPVQAERVDPLIRHGLWREALFNGQGVQIELGTVGVQKLLFRLFAVGLIVQ